MMSHICSSHINNFIIWAVWVEMCMSLLCGWNVCVLAMLTKCVCPLPCWWKMYVLAMLMKNACPCHADEMCMSLPCRWNVYVHVMLMKWSSNTWQREIAACSHWPVSLGLAIWRNTELNWTTYDSYNMHTVRQHWDAVSLCPLTLPLFRLFVPTLKIVVLKTTRMTAVHCRPLWPRLHDG